MWISAEVGTSDYFEVLKKEAIKLKMKETRRGWQTTDTELKSKYFTEEYSNDRFTVLFQHYYLLLSADSDFVLDRYMVKIIPKE